MGATLAPDADFGLPQLVRYEKGQKFDLHHDWFDEPQRVKGRGQGQGRGGKGWYNRGASFFVWVEDGCTEGETWFPHVRARGVWGDDDADGGGRKVEGKWREYGEGGTAFAPRRGNALFWVNLHENGTGDGRVVHAGLPLGGGRKTAMNIWPRRYF